METCPICKNQLNGKARHNWRLHAEYWKKAADTWYSNYQDIKSDIRAALIEAGSKGIEPNLKTVKEIWAEYLPQEYTKDPQ